MDSIIFDIDGTICPIKTKEEKYEDLIPNFEMIEKIKELKENGYKIILFTARNMKTYKNDLKMILEKTKPILEDWLKKWEIPYDELIFGKPWPGPKGFYVDDRTIRPKELLNLSMMEIKEKMENDKS